MAKIVKLVPRYVTDSPPPPPPPAGAMTHLMMQKTQFGGLWSNAENDFYYGPPLYRCVVQMSGNPDELLSRNPNGRHLPYCLLWSAVSDTPTNSEYNSYWVQLAEQFATSSGFDPEDLFIHSGNNQKTKEAKIASIDADGTVHLDLVGGRYFRTTLMKVGDEYIIANNSNATFNGQCTILSVVDYRTFVIDKAAGGPGTGGSVYQLGDGSKTKANRLQFFLWDNWRYTLNPGTEAARQWAIFKQAKTMGTKSGGVFYDEMDSGNLKGVSLEYATDADYEASVANLLAQLRAAYPTKLIEANIASFSKETDFNTASAAGGCQVEQFPNVFAYSVDSVISWIKRLRDAGVTVEVPMTPEWKTNVAGRQMFIPSGFAASGGHHYQTPEARCFVLSYALYMQLLDSDIHTYGNYLLYWQPMPGKIETVDKLSKWFPIAEYNVGRAMGAYTILADGALAQDGGPVRIFARKFSKDGTNVHCLMLHSRSRPTDTKQYGSGTTFNVPVEAAPVGTDWWFLDENGQFSFQVTNSIDLWCSEAAFLIAVPR